ncbi:MAG: valine--tRNA ligase [Candidatus Phytoplasma stylosanthis]|nr:valine--tRNA ligase [Candidatus Phytoplasma stylosanthis]
MKSSKYNFKLIEENRYKKWLDKNYFQTENDLKKTPFTIMMPPPNITGQLHLGHAWNNILQDIIIRNKKMLGYDVLFLPGMDHAGIATQAKIKQKLKEEGFDDKKITKDIFLKYSILWKEKYFSIIRSQWSNLGLFIDYKYERFTLEPSLKETVSKVFIQLYQDNLIYRDYKIINWDPVLQTTISNIEVDYRKVEGKLFYLKYFFVHDNDLFLEVATTRPETIFADQALAVHPDDLRYNTFIGKKVLVPYTNSVIDVIGDISVDVNFGSGVVKITPAHDENDFQIGKKNNLKNVTCINKNGTMNEIALKYQNLKILICREKIINDLKKDNLVSKEENYNHYVGFSSISNSLIESRVSLQWFLRTKKIYSFFSKEEKINFFPKRFSKVFDNWFINAEDWCISRQLWWGHPLPVWYKDNQVKVQEKKPEGGFIRDPDVLDTWFSSSLWPLLTLGWPNFKNNLFARRFPLDVLVTGYDILTFWVTKMFLQSTYFVKKIPFRNVLLHGLVRDQKFQKMSKSKGNGVIPEEIIKKYGTDTLRWFLTTSVSNGSDLSFNEKKIMNSWNFINKLWNISRFIQANIFIKEINFQEENLFLPEKALLFQLSELIKEINMLYKKYEFDKIGQLLYHFVWEDFGNWFLEFLKVFKKNINSQKLFLFVLNSILKLLHPFIPFITDAIFEELNFNESIIKSSWPNLNYSNKEDFYFFQSLKKLIIKFRGFKKNNKINELYIQELYIKTSLEKIKKLEYLMPFLSKFFQVNQVKLINNVLDNDFFELFIEQDFSILINKKIEKFNYNSKIYKNLKKQKEILLSEIQRSENILNNNCFLEKANPKKVQEEKDKYQKYLKQYQDFIKNNNI